MHHQANLQLILRHGIRRVFILRLKVFISLFALQQENWAIIRKLKLFSILNIVISKNRISVRYPFRINNTNTNWLI